MRPSEKEDDAKKTGFRPEPLCLFCFPEDVSFIGGKTYVNAIKRDKGRDERTRRFIPDIRQKEKEDFWLRKRTEARIKRRRMKEPITNLKSYLLTSVKNEKLAEKPQLPSLFEVLETVKDAWPSPSTRNKSLLRHETQPPTQPQKKTPNQPTMKAEETLVQITTQLLTRRLSMPEELMRKYSVSKEKTSEESETNKTAIEISPSSSSAIETARRKDTSVIQTERKIPEEQEPTKADAGQQTEGAEDRQPKKEPKRVTQSDYYKQGKRILKVKAVDKGTCTCRREEQSSTTASAKEDTDESGTTESLPSSSPTQLPKRESSSGNLSSESDNIRCTCAELSSKETSTDLYLSGKSTLSQSVSDKSMSTQDSTVSINSVSTRGSTGSDNSNSTTPEIERTSAKETTTSPDYSPKTPRNRKNRRRDKPSYYQGHDKSCPKHNEIKHSRNQLPSTHTRHCPLHSENTEKTTANAATNTDKWEDSTTQTEVAVENKKLEVPPEIKTPAVATEERYKWAKLSQEELYMMQQLRHRNFIESQMKLSKSFPPAFETESITSCGTGSAYTETKDLDQAIMIPRYSALPRSLSMLVNTSSPDTSHNSDSDNQSLADSLEDQPVTHVHKLYFDTKKESKPVRGDVSLVQESKHKHRQPRGRAFFVSIKEPFGEDKMLENIEKIPQPPEKIKNQIFERHLSLCAKHKQQHPTEEPKGKKENQKIKKKNKHSDEKTSKGKKNDQEESKKHDRGQADKSKRKEDQKKLEQTETVPKKKKEASEAKSRASSRIPVLVSSRSTSSSPERDPETKDKSARPKTRLRREKEEAEATADPPTHQSDMETTQILEITHSGTELSLQKPQAVIHPSQAPLEPKTEHQLVIPPLVSTLRIPPFRQTWNKPLLAPVRRSPVGKFRQRFEVIPEEKSSSLSSAEEKNPRECLPKFTDASTSPVPSVQSYDVNDVSNLIVAKITNKQLETLPYVRSTDNQKIILFSSKGQNSTKGRDALIAMNREDFNRLAKGWMSFYKLNMEQEDGEEKGKDRHEETAEKTSRNKSNKPNSETAPEVTKLNERKLDENVRFDCSNTILRAAKSVQTENSSRNLKRQNSLPELNLPSQRGCDVHRSSTTDGFLPSVGKRGDEDDTDSDSTDYLEPPSPRVPPLPIDDIPSDGTLSSTDSELDVPKPQVTTQSLRYLQLKKRSTTNRGRQKRDNSDASRCGKKSKSENSGWSVTVAGTVELSRSAPDLEMRLSFPASGGPPVVSQSDSGFAEDSNNTKLSDSLQDLDVFTARKELPFGEGNARRKWLVTVNDPKLGSGKELASDFGFPNKTNHLLPNLEPTKSRNPKKVLKDNVEMEEKVKRVIERKMRAIWPKVQKAIKKEFLTESGRLITELEPDFDDDSCLTVRGNAVTFEKKQKPATMTERDITRRYTSRTEPCVLQNYGEVPETGSKSNDKAAILSASTALSG